MKQDLLKSLDIAVNGTWGNLRKLCEKNGQCNQCDFLQVLSKSSWTTFETIFETLSALGACHVTITAGVVYKKSMIFKIFGVQ